ncbi:unnamed protein product [Rhizoctonia solani]|nr:unnamed protein product [Rhizoctonia solani]
MSTTAALLDSAQLIAQGAEARVYKTTLGSPPVLLKHRFPKQYRNSALDVSLTKQRVSGEARALLRCLRYVVNSGGGAEGEEEVDVAEEEIEDEEAEMDELKDVYGLTQERLMTLIGEEIAKMHKSDIIHGDLTTSNMMLRQDTKNKETQLVLIDFGLSYNSVLVEDKAVLIDFGLSYNSVLVEDKAVDLYVLERAFASTHPQSEGMFIQVLEAYGRVSGPAWKNIKRRLDDVRLRGRKRSMVG